MKSGLVSGVRAGVLAAVAAMAAGTVAAGQEGKIVDRSEPRDWTLKVTVNVRPHTEYDPKTGMPNRAAFDFTSAAVVFPLILGTASSESPGGTGVLSLNDRPADTEPDMLMGD